MIKGAGTTSATTALLVQNANASASLTVRDDNVVTVGSNFGLPTSAYVYWGDINSSIQHTGTSLNFRVYQDNQPWSFITANNGSVQASINTGFVRAKTGFSATSNSQVTVSGWDGGGGTAGNDLLIKGGNSGTSPSYTGGNGANLILENGLATDNSQGKGGTPGSIVFKYGTYNNTASVEYGRINSLGSLLIGTTTDTGHKLTISGSNSSGSLNVNNTLYVSGSRVGIGTSSPAFKLEVVSGDTRFSNGVTIGTAGASGWQFSSNTVTLIQNGFIGVDVAGGRHFNITDTAFSTYYFRVAPTTGNILIGTSTDAGYKLDVNGTANINGNLTLSGYRLFTNTTSDWIQSATSIGLPDSRTMQFAMASGILMELGTSGNFLWNSNGSGARFYQLRPSNGQTSVVFQIRQNPNQGTNTLFGVNGLGDVDILPRFTDSSGTTSRNTLNISPIINNTGTYSGTVRGLYYNPTLTSLTGTTHRAIETTSGDVLLGTTSGRVAIGTSADTGHELLVSGSGASGSANLDNTLYVSGSNVGIGTSTPSAPLHVVFNPATSAGINIDATTNTTNHIAFMRNGVVYGRFGVNASSGEFRWDSPAGSYFPTIYSNGVEAMRIATTQNVLIGTTTDAGFRLDVNGTARVQGTLTIPSTGNYGITITRSGTSGIAQQVSNSSGTTYLGVDSSAGGFLFTNGLPYASFFGNGANYPTQFGTNGITRMTIFAGGNVGINTTTDTGHKLLISGSGTLGSLNVDNTLYVSGSRVGIGTGTPVVNLQVGDGTNGANSLYVGGNVSSTQTIGFAVNGSTVYHGLTSNANTGEFRIGAGFNGGGHYLVFSSGNNTERMRIASSGNILIGTTTDAGYLLDVNGTARVVTSILVGAGSGTGTVQTGVCRATYFNSYANNFTIFETNNSTGAAKFYQAISVGTSSDPVASAQLEVVSTTKGFLPPRMTGAQAELISSPAEGLMIYATAGTGVTITSKGWWGYDGATWVKLN